MLPPKEPKNLEQQLALAHEMLKSQEVYEYVLDLMGDPWGEHKRIATNKMIERMRYDVDLPGERAERNRVRQRHKLEMKKLLRDDVLRSLIVAEMAKECRFRLGGCELETLERNLGLKSAFRFNKVEPVRRFWAYIQRFWEQHDHS